MNNILPYRLVIFLLTLLLSTASCQRSDVAGNQNNVEAKSNGAAEETLTTPPFATKEPERYQAVRVETGSSEGTNSFSRQTFMARDGARRREDYETPEGIKISSLELPTGSYVLLPDKKLYAELKPDAKVGAANQMSVPPDFSPDKLLNEARPETHYEKLGAETVNGRATMKYRVTLKGKTGTPAEVTTENLIWIDKSLGMPVKSEMTSTGNGAGSTHVTMELRDIKETVEAGVFELPPDYRKVEARDIFAQLKQTSPP